MGISPYPRVGYRLAPASLREALDVPIPSQLLTNKIPKNLKLSDLDESCWKSFSPTQCEKLSNAIIHRVKTKIALTKRHRLLPSPPYGIKLKDLDVAERTYRCLVNLAKKKVPSRNKKQKVSPDEIPVSDVIGGMAISDILTLRNFGLTSLIDLLVALEFYTSQKQEYQNSSVDLWQDINDKVAYLKQKEFAGKVDRDDPRLGNLIRSIDSYAKNINEINDNLFLTLKSSVQAEIVLKQLHELTERTSKIVKNKLEDDLQDFERLFKNKRDSMITYKYLGFDGEGGHSLQEVGDQYHITRERTRQIYSQAIKIFNSKTFIPIIDRILQEIYKRIPVSAEDLEGHIFKKGLTKNRFRLEGIRHLGGLLNRKIKFSIINHQEKRFVVLDDAPDLMRASIALAKKYISKNGVANVEDIVSKLSDKLRTDVKHNFVRDTLERQTDFNWLDKSSGWFWLSTNGRNRLLNQIRKIFVVTQKVEISELRRGVSRNYRTEGFAPPRRVLLELCRQLNEVKVEGNYIFANRTANKNKLLGETENIFNEVLQKNGSVMQRDKLEEECVKLGLKQSTFWMYLINSPIIAKYAQGVYGIIGAELEPGYVDSLIPKGDRKRNTVTLDYGWTSEGRIWTGYELSKPMIYHGSVSIPAAMKKYIIGDFSLKAENGLTFGKVTVKDYGMIGFKKMFERSGVEIGDYMVISVDPKSKEVVVYIGDDDLIDTFRSNLATQNLENTK